jgi:outer membrane protein assembly factor BamB
MSSVAVHDGLLFTADCGRNLYCIDDTTGQVLWTLDTEGEVWATPLIADGKVYLGTRRGDFWILKASREKEVLCKTRLDSPISATATVLNHTIYLATMENLYAFALPDSTADE